jgi:hypothetical protein
MRNAVLHLVTNKSSDFGSDMLPTNSSFRAFPASAGETAIRNTLKINDDLYYLLNSLVAVYAFPEVLTEFRESETTFDLNAFRLPPLTITNAEYYNTATTNFNVVLQPATFPTDGYFNWTVSYNNESSLDIYCCNQAYTVPYTKSLSLDGCEVIEAIWPEVSGLSGGFKLPITSSWATGYVIQLYVPPISFPYKAAVDLITALPGTSKVLADAGVARNFFNAQSDIEKYALLMLAISRPDIRNPVASTC